MDTFDSSANAPRRRLKGRREFLKHAGALPIALAAAQAAAGAVASSGMPMIPFGKYSLSRLVCGSNPFNAGSHLSVFVNQEMRAYYTPDQILKTLRRCQEAGVNAWQSGSRNLDLHRRFLDEGGHMHFLSIESDTAALAKLAEAKCIGVAHHGEVTDQLFKSGKLGQLQDFLKRVRESGMMVGVSTHMPAVVDAIESAGWDLDYYMTCVYERHRTEEELKKLLGHVPIPVREVYLQEDPPRMYQAIQATKRHCLAFKILAAGRLSERRDWVEKAFRETFRAVKPIDGVIVGLYDKFADQAADNAALVRRFGSGRTG